MVNLIAGYLPVQAIDRQANSHHIRESAHNLKKIIEVANKTASRKVANQTNLLLANPAIEAENPAITPADLQPSRPKIRRLAAPPALATGGYRADGEGNAVDRGGRRDGHEQALRSRATVGGPVAYTLPADCSLPSA
jgi:hypothetical protein